MCYNVYENVLTPDREGNGMSHLTYDSATQVAINRT